MDCAATSGGFALLDYVALLLFLAGIVGVGLGSANAPANSSEGYFLAGRAQSSWVVAISLLSGITSGCSVLGMPGFVFSDKDGAGFVGFAVSGVACLCALPACFLFITAFSSLQAVTAYEYLELRFSAAVRVLVSGLFVLKTVLYLAVVLCAAALALEALLGLAKGGMIAALGLASTGFTLKGGMRAVLFVDFVQSLALLGVLGASLACLLPAWRAEAFAAPRSFFTLDPQPVVSLGAMGLAAPVSFVAQTSCDQVAVQRFLTTKNPGEARRAALGGCALNALASVVLAALGALLRACYRATLPPGLGSADAILPFFVGQRLPSGVAGVFLGAIFGCTVSVFAGSLNAAAACITLDLLAAARGGPPEDVVSASRWATGVVGGLATCAAMALAGAGSGVVSASQAAIGLTLGPVFGVFVLGLLVPFANAPGALCGLAAALAFAGPVGAAQLLCVGQAPCQGVLGALTVSPYWCCALLGGTCAGVGAAASLAFPPPTQPLTYWAVGRRREEQTPLLAKA